MDILANVKSSGALLIVDSMHKIGRWANFFFADIAGGVIGPINFAVSVEQCRTNCSFKIVLVVYITLEWSIIAA